MNIHLFIEAGLTQDLISIMDNSLNVLSKECESIDDPDAMGYFDNMENIIGLGFVALQAFMTAMYGPLKVEKNIKNIKKIALEKGPKHKCGYSIARIVNDTANYWKHHDEWGLDKKNHRRELIESTFESIGLSVEDDYPLSGVMMELSAPNSASLGSVFDKLLQWQNELQHLD